MSNIGPPGRLTARERRILALIGAGLTNRQIGQRMFLAEQAVKNYVSALLQKLGMERRTQAAAYPARLSSMGHDGMNGEGWVNSEGGSA